MAVENKLLPVELKTTSLEKIAVEELPIDGVSVVFLFFSQIPFSFLKI